MITKTKVIISRPIKPYIQTFNFNKQCSWQGINTPQSDLNFWWWFQALLVKNTVKQYILGHLNHYSVALRNILWMKSKVIVWMWFLGQQL